jgi:hypothetical protein
MSEVSQSLPIENDGRRVCFAPNFGATAPSATRSAKGLKLIIGTI